MDTAKIIAWYRANKREMPWRGNPDPYAVWVSEIMLQQTRVETVRGYFSRFLQRFPTFQALAKAPQEAVLKAWEGLGYYSRARNLQKAAQSLTSLPVTLEGWRNLPGVGAYTAAAIASVCFGIRVPVVDGNVIRVAARLRRLSDDFQKTASREKLALWLQRFIDAADSPGEFNQAMMELGETLCTPRSPQCERCPLAESCEAGKKNQQGQYPRRKTKKSLPVRQAIALRIAGPRGTFFFAHRPAEGLLGGLWELPNAPSRGRGNGKTALQKVQALTGLHADTASYAGTVAHVFSHFKLLLHVYEISGVSDGKPAGECRFARPEQLPLATATRKALKLGRALKR